MPWLGFGPFLRSVDIGGQVALIQIQKQKRMILSPKDIANARLVYPMPAWDKR